jgi:predicted TIM-barrel fold metal-dependent hydrolase
MRYPQYLAEFLRIVPANGIIMVHPGLNEPWRRAEYEALLANIREK